MFSVKFAYDLLRKTGEEENSRLYNFFWRTKARASGHVIA